MLRIRLSVVVPLAALAAVVCCAQVTITEYPMPGGSPDSITVGPDGNLWFDEESGYNRIGRITTTGAVTEFSAPTPSAVAAGPDGNIWVTLYASQAIGKMTTAGSLTLFPAGGYPYGITPGTDGNLWFTERFGNNIGRITTAGNVTEFPVPTGGSQPAGITAGRDGNLWFVEGTANKIGQITIAGVITEFSVPSTIVAPNNITWGPDGNLWFTEVGNKIARMTTAGVVTEFALPTIGAQTDDITVGPDGNLWFTEEHTSQIGRITTAGVVTEFATPTYDNVLSGITLGPDGNLWFSESQANKIGKIIVDHVGPITSNVSVAPNPLAVNTASSLSAIVSDLTTGDSTVASAYYSISGGTPYQMALTTSGPCATCAGGMFTPVTTQATATLATFSQSNVYNVCVQGTDSAGNTGANACVLLPVYDPSGSFVTGGGQVPSPVGADLLNPSTTGPATFGFVSKYLPGRNTPSGNLEFQYKAGSMDFKSTSMDWLVVTGEPRAQFHGIGTINGTNVCNFQVDAWAGSYQGNVDAFGLTIFSCSNGGDRYRLPATPLTGGSIIIHK
jgi:virginiamycin B lyase